MITAVSIAEVALLLCLSILLFYLSLLQFRLYTSTLRSTVHHSLQIFNASYQTKEWGYIILRHSSEGFYCVHPLCLWILRSPTLQSYRKHWMSQRNDGQWKLTLNCEAWTAEVKVRTVEMNSRTVRPLQLYENSSKKKSRRGVQVLFFRQFRWIFSRIYQLLRRSWIWTRAMSMTRDRIIISCSCSIAISCKFHSQIAIRQPSQSATLKCGHSIHT